MHKVKAIVLGLLFLGTLVLVPSAKAQSNNYKQTNLTSDTRGMANFPNVNLRNPSGIAYIPGGPFWIANSISGTATLHDRSGNLQGTVSIPGLAGSSNLSRPTGVVANTSDGFKVGGESSSFIFATEDGTIFGLSQRTQLAKLAVDNSKTGAAYTGLAMVRESGGKQVLLAANFKAGIVEMFDDTFTPIAREGAFKDASLPAGFAPFGVHVVGENEVVVTFAQQNAQRNPDKAPGAGFASLFDFQGNFVNRIASQGTLNAPFGAAIAPAGFGQFEGALLIGNFGDGTINAFDKNTQTFLGQLKDENGKVLINPSLSELVFDSTGRTGAAKTLYITAGLANAMHGLFAAVTPDTTGSPDFSLSASPTTLTVTRGTSGTVTITATALNGFNSPINNFTCSGQPSGSTCAFSKTSLMPVGSTTDSMTVSLQTTTPMPGPYGVMSGMGMWLPLSSMGMFGLVVVETRRRKKLERRKLWRWLGYACGIALLCGALLSASGCGGYSSSSHTTGGTPTGTSTLTISGQSGSTSHSATVTLTVQ